MIYLTKADNGPNVEVPDVTIQIGAREVPAGLSAAGLRDRLVGEAGALYDALAALPATTRHTLTALLVADLAARLDTRPRVDGYALDVVDGVLDIVPAGSVR